MRRVKLIGCVQLILLMALVVTKPGSLIAMAIPCFVAGLLLVTWRYATKENERRRGWPVSFALHFLYLMVPTGFLLHRLAPAFSLPLLAVAVFVVHAEWFRERQDQTSELGWIALPAISMAIAFYLQWNSMTLAASVTLLMIALVATSILYHALSKTKTLPSDEGRAAPYLLKGERFTPMAEKARPRAEASHAS